MTRGVLIGAALIALCLCAALVLIGAGAAYFYYSSRGAISGRPIVSVPTALPLPASPTLPPPSPTGGVTPAAGGATPAVDEATRAMLVEIEQQVIALRGLQPSGKFELRFTTPDEYKLKTKGDFETDYSPEEAVDDARVLHALGLLPANFDLYNFYIDLYSEQILGSYDPKTKELYVIKASGKIGGVERQTYAHEFNHALQDENYDMRSLGLSDDACERDTERCAAIRALVEGDSTLLESQWLKRYGTTQDYADIGEYYSNYTSTAYDRAPCYLRDDFYWPYDDGLKFVQGLYDSGGWAAVDDAYRRPPVSTEQIMHPKLYKSGDIPEMIPAPVLTDTLGAGWRQIDSNVMGEWYTRLILLEPFRNSDPQSSDYCRPRWSFSRRGTRRPTPASSPTLSRRTAKRASKHRRRRTIKDRVGTTGRAESVASIAGEAIRCG
ncbi:MAG: hypothetical protein HY023_04590 [Chloroflexi bacterium]|nr:hypothetical protein [Chloroflexota bacterium]